MSKNLKILFLYPNDYFMNMLPPAIALFSSLLKREGYEVDLFDTTYHSMDNDHFYHDKVKEASLQVLPTNMGDRGVHAKTTSAFDDFSAKIESFHPDLIAMSTVEDTFLRGVSLLKHVRHYKIPTIVGGVFPTFAPEKAISYDCIDMVCVGEGENVLLELCKRMSNGKEYCNVPGLWTKTKTGIEKNQMGERFPFDEIPFPDFTIFEEGRLYRPMAGKVYRMLPVETHRGCPYKCAYCNSPAQNELYRSELNNPYFRKKEMQSVFEYLCFCRDQWKAEYFYFTADTFLALSSKEFDAFVEMYSSIKIPFYFNTRPETITPYRMKRLKEIGLHRMSMGCEHGDEKFRREIIKRQVSNDVIIRAFDCAADHGVSTTVNNIIGFPGETRDLVFSTIELNRKLRVDTMNCVTFAPFHGTALRQLAIEKGYLDDSVIAKCLMQGSLLEMPDLSTNEICALMNTFPLYSRLEISRWPDIEKVEQNFNSTEVEELYGELKKEYYDRFFSGASVS